MKHRISPATILSALALFFSLGGVGMAATGYRITSIFQIAPKVRHQLRGARGPVGPQGPRGPAGSSATVTGPPGTRAADPAVATIQDEPHIGAALFCGAFEISYVGFGASPEPIALTWTDNGTPIRTQTVMTNLPEETNNSISTISVVPPPVPAGDVLGVSVSWNFVHANQVGPYQIVSYC